LDAIGFGLGSLLEEVRDGGKALDLVFSVDEHEIPISSAGTTESFPQLKIKDIRKHIADSPSKSVNVII
jgi:hypothetical protein